MSNDHSDLFIFAIPGGKQPTTARKTHICRLYDILQLCIQRRDLERARRAWSALVRCKEINWKVMWRIGLALLGGVDDPEHQQHGNEPLEYLATMMLQFSEARESILHEMVLRLIMTGQYQRALEELELYLPSPPYEDNSTLHIYAGLTCVYLAQPEMSDQVGQQIRSNSNSWNESMLRRAQQYLERASVLDSKDLVARSWLERLPSLSQASPENRGDSPDSDDERMTVDDGDGVRSKRVRT